MFGTDTRFVSCGNKSVIILLQICKLKKPYLISRIISLSTAMHASLSLACASTQSRVTIAAADARTDTLSVALLARDTCCSVTDSTRDNARSIHDVVVWVYKYYSTCTCSTCTCIVAEPLSSSIVVQADQILK
jgi:hypothetical protein